ncbi:MAG: tyrosine-protein phosphatase [Candidatus Tectomicrobia bacterium]|nr:tyrosine-protein phosphatase [Candidatus Tectomicrobia bacterium]
MQRTTSSDPQRHLPLEGTYNVRDVGGYGTVDGRLTRWGILFRADGLHRLPPKAQEQLHGHGVKTVVDLRRSDELEAAPNVFAESSHVTYHHMSLLIDKPPVVVENPKSLIETYRIILDERQDQVRTVLSTFAAPQGLPGVVHCTAGKDRTGVIVALILGLCGVPHDTIVADYALTSMYLGEAFMEESRQRALKRGYTWEQYQPMVTCPPENMEATLHHLDTTYGGFEAYADHIGFAEDQIRRLREALLG